MSERSTSPRATGRCLCGSIRYSITGPIRDVSACHCTECRRFTGSVWHATAARRADLQVRDNGHLKWFQSSLRARRGFCANCGSSLFFDFELADYMVVTAGTLDAPTGLSHRAHIFLDEKGDYYELDDGLAKYPRGGHGLTIPEA